MPRTVPARLAATTLLTVALSAAAACGGAPEEQRATALGGTLTAPPPAVTTTAPRPVATPAPTPVVPRGDGQLVVVPGVSAVAGTGPPTTYAVEVEGGLGVDALAFAVAVERTLADPRSWGAGGRRALQRVSHDDVVFRVALASPETTDRLCAPLDTGGHFSCANGDRAVLNAARWLTGADTYTGHLPEYRQYLLNHEVGHTLGFGHVGCPSPGAPAPVMLQQTKSLEGCTRSSWPYP